MRKIKSIVTAAVFAALTLSFYGCNDKGSDSSSSNNVVYYDSAENSYVNPNEQVATMPTGENMVDAAIGTKSDMDNYSAEFVKLIDMGNIGPDTVRPNEVNSYGAVFEITNNSDKDLNVSSLCNFHIELDDGSLIYSATAGSISQAQAIITDYDLFLDTTVAPGETVTGYYPFEVPTGWSHLKFYYFPEYSAENYDSFVYDVTPEMVAQP